MTTYLGKSCSFCLPWVPFVNCRQFMYLVISLLVLRAGYGIWLYQFLIIAYLFTLVGCIWCFTALHFRSFRARSVHQSLKLNFKSCRLNIQSFNIYIYIKHRLFQDGANVAVVCVSRTHTLKCRLPDKVSIFTAEIHAISMALDYVRDTHLSKVIIRFHNLSNKRIILCWLPSYDGIKGNEKAHTAAKSALLLPPSNFKLPYTGFKPVINKYLLNKW